VNSSPRSIRATPALLRFRCLVTAIASAIGFSSAEGAQLNVTSCGDALSDSGSLRSKITAAGNNDVVSLASLTCPNSLITLTQGAIPISVDNLTIESSSNNHMAISGNNMDRVISHSGLGTVSISDLTIEQGSFTTPMFAHAFVEGGCIYSPSGNVSLTDSTVTGCSITSHTQRTGSDGEGPRGGGVGLENGTLTMTRSTVSFNFALSVDPQYSTGGGGVSVHTLIAVDSIIRGNLAIPGSQENSSGGGVLAETVTLTNSAVFDNDSVFGGGLYIEGGSSSSLITNSTISGNSGAASGGGISSRNPLTLINTTIAFNESNVGAGLYQQDSALVMQSSIIADNANVYGNRADLRLSSATISGSNNLITDTTDTLPTGTITAEPRLAPLALHGGTSPVHPLLPGSPALNVGNNSSGLQFDQRGAGYSRTFGAATDIGAYESQGVKDDELFFDGFSPLR
jgi:hypothetical protein